MADEDIIIRYVVQAEEALRQAEAMRRAIEQSKIEIKALADQSALSFKDISTVFKDMIAKMPFSAENQKALGKLLSVDISGDEEEFIARRTQAVRAVGMAISEMEQEATRAVSEHYTEEQRYAREAAQIVREMEQLKAKETRESEQQRARDARELTAEQKRLAQEAAQTVREMEQQKIAAQNEFNQSVRSGVEAQSAAAKEYGDQVRATYQQILSQSQTTGQTFQQSAQAVIDSGTSIEQVRSAYLLYGQDVKRVNQEIVGQSKQTGESFQVVADRLARTGENAVIVQAAMTQLKMSGQDAIRAKQLEIEAMKNYEQVTKDGYGNMTQAGANFGAAVERVKQQIVAQAAASGQTYEEVAQGLNRAGMSANITNTAIKELTLTEQQQMAAMREYERITRQGWGTMSADAQMYGQRVQEVKTLIMQMAQAEAQRQGMDARTFALEQANLYQQMAEQLQNAGVGVNVLNSALRELDPAGQRVNVMMDLIQAEAQATGQSFKMVAQQIRMVQAQIQTQSAATGQPFAQVAQAMAQAGVSTNLLNAALVNLQSGAVNANAKTNALTQAVANLNNTTTNAGHAARGLGSMLTNVLTVAFGINLYNAIQKVINSLGEFIQKGNEVAESFFLLEVGVRALRRAGVDVTSKALLDNLQRLNEETGKFYTQLQLVQGAAAFANLIRDMGFTRDEIFKLQESIITLAIVNGRSMDEVQRTVALALSSGYTEGLQRLGLSINRVNIAARANQMGFEGGYTALTEHERALATLSLIMEKTAKYSDDLNEAQNRLFGGIKGTQSAIEDTKNAIGEQLLPIWLLLLQLVKGFIDILARIPFIAVIRGLTGIYQAIQVLPKVWEAATKSTDNFFERIQHVAKFIGEVSKAISQLKPLNEVFSDFAGFGQEEVPLGTPDLTGGEGGELEESGKELADYVRELYNDIEEEKRRFNNRMAELDRDLTRDLEKIERERDRDLLELFEDYQQDKLKIAEDESRKIADAEEKYHRDVVEANDDYQRKIADANRKYQQDQIDAERKYQEEMRKLREEFLFDLDDALAERDAKAVLKLIKRYNLDKEQAGRDYALERQEREEAHQQELEDIRRQRDEKLAELAEELELKIQQIRREAAIKQAERDREYEWDKADRMQKAEEDKADREVEHQNRIKELQIQFSERMEELIAELSGEKGMTADLLSQIANEYAKTYGPNGMIDRYMQYYIQMLAVRTQQAIALNQMLQKYGKYGYPTYSLDDVTTGTGGSGGGGGGGQPPPVKMAEGGVMYANTPTHVVFGEAGWERAEFTPVSKMGQNSGRFAGIGSVPPSASGAVAIRVDLSPDLIGRIEENTLNQAAEVLLEVQRRVR